MHFDREISNLFTWITVFNTTSGLTSRVSFDRLPLRIGRNPHNDLVLNHPHVSQWHATLGHVGGRLSLLQVGRSNSVHVDAKALRPDECVVLSGSEVIAISPFRLSLVIEQTPKARCDELVDSQVARGQGEAAAPAAPERMVATVIPPKQAQASQAPAAPAAPPQPVPEVVLAPPAAAAPAAAEAAPDSPEAALRRIAQRYGVAAQTPAELAALAQQIDRVLTTCLDHIAALRQGQRQLEAQLLGTSAPPDTAWADGKALGHALLGAARGAPALDLSALARGLAELGARQVALLEGFRAGVRALLERLSPDVVSRVAAKRHRLLGIKTLWKTYCQVHADLAEEGEHTFQTIFGPRFVAAFARAAGGKGAR